MLLSKAFMLLAPAVRMGKGDGFCGCVGVWDTGGIYCIIKDPIMYYSR